MQTRHRIPTIFNLSMVDVLCCALGCVILLWLVYFKEARERAMAVGQTNKQLSATRLQLENVLLDFASAQKTLLSGKHRNEYLSGQLEEVLTQRNQLLAKWEKTDKDHQAALQALEDGRASIAALRKDLGGLEKMNLDQKNALASAALQANDLKSKTAAAEDRANDLKSKLVAAGDRANDLKSKIVAAEDRAGKLGQEAAALKALSGEHGQQLAKIETRAMVLEQDLEKRKLDVAEANKRFDDLLAQKNLLEKKLAESTADLARSEKALVDAKSHNQGLAGETQVLTQQVNKLRAAAENRFAGIELTGSHVLFLVDMSGSMAMKDNDLADPDKWPLLCEILGKLIQSLPDLQFFQIILFSDRFRYPLGNDGKWHEYRGPGSVKVAIEAVRAVKPQNATNMSTVFEEAFRYRALGLDTIYLLSDGLPNMGAGLPANASKLSESELGAVLGKFIRDRLKSTWNVPYGRWVKQRVRINTVGFYFDSPDVGAFLWALARDNDGSFVGLSKP